MTDEDYIRPYLDDPTSISTPGSFSFLGGDETSDSLYIRQYLDDPISD